MGGGCTVRRFEGHVRGPKDVCSGMPSISSGKLRHGCCVGAGAALQLWVKGFFAPRRKGQSLLSFQMSCLASNVGLPLKGCHRPWYLSLKAAMKCSSASMASSGRPL